MALVIYIRDGKVSQVESFDKDDYVPIVLRPNIDYIVVDIDETEKQMNE